MNQYISYDIRGIQAYIFAVPRLKYIIGGSSLIDQFDRDTAGGLGGQGVIHVFSGGGRGLYYSPDLESEALIGRIVAAVHRLGLDVRIGQDADPSRAAQEASRLYSYQVERLDGEPCSASALFPVPPGQGRGYRDEGRSVHPLIWRRVQAAREDRIGVELLQMLHAGLPTDLQEAGAELSFMRSVSSDETDSPDDQALAALARESLGQASRWAVVAMDGNDMGLQHQAAAGEYKGAPVRHLEWLADMSRALDATTRQATANALAQVISRWWKSTGAEKARRHTGRIVLPFRPLVVGGDDVLVLSHPAYAVDLARSVCEQFEQISRQPDRAPFWKATGNRLTISGGILFCGTSFPLASAIQYAENLLRGAKGKFRGGCQPGQPTPAAIDWEQVSEGAIDTPAERRNRELLFKDGDVPGKPEVFLTRRPYAVSQMNELDKRILELGQLPNSIVHDLLPGLRKGRMGRIRFLARLRKRHPALYDLLEEPLGEGPPKGEGWKLEASSGRLTSDVIDAVLLLQERAAETQEVAR